MYPREKTFKMRTCHSIEGVGMLEIHQTGSGKRHLLALFLLSLITDMDRGMGVLSIDLFVVEVVINLLNHSI
jgi:hypothetical protein